ncbi:Hsp70 family protein [Dactylosporangium sp. CA-139114]|uniref:Hsp70 family protein n=1 Tax=Dactylosporangium sp. CA-139114 TaxID=3239931 RepID=UPI003D9677B2
MPTPGIRLGVDFGTSNTVAVVRWPDGRSRPLIFDGSPLLPSAVYAEPGGAIIVGRDAVHSARLEPARFEPNPKRRIDDGTVLLGDREVPVQELIAAVLRRVRDEWVRTVGDVVPEATVTIPASWGATRRLAIADAAEAAGLGRVRLVPEPVAAAAYFTQVLGHEVKIGSVVVVHDFGAGTFDASVVARTADGFEALAVDGRDDIGGIDVDNAVVKHIGTICEPRAPQEWSRLMSPQTVEDRRHRRLLWDDARVAKERLSRQPASDLTIPLLNFDVHLTREELETLARPMIEQTVRVTQGVMRWAQLAEGSVAGVFLVGGSSRMPLVATLLHRMLGTAPTAIEQPELVVAEGSMLTGSKSTQPSAQPAPGPSTGVLPQVPGFPWERPEQQAVQPPVSAPPVSTPPAFSMPPPSRFGTPVSAPPAQSPMWPHTPPVAPVSVPPPVSAPPQVSSPPPVSSPPVSAPPNRPVSAGRVYGSGGGVPESVTRYDEYGRAFRNETPQRQPPQPPRPQPQPQRVADHAHVYSGGKPRRGPAARFFRVLFVVVLLVAVPLVAGVISYYLTTDHLPPLLQEWLHSNPS